MCKKIEGTRVEIRPSDKPGAREFLENQNNLSQSLTYMIDMWIDLFGDGDIMANLTDNIKSVIAITNDISIDEVNDSQVEAKPKEVSTKPSKAKAATKEEPEIEIEPEPTPVTDSATNNDDDLAAMGLGF